MVETLNTRDEILTEIVNLEAITQLPKATEHFISDLHGEFEAFDHLMRNCSGVIQTKVEDLYSQTLTEKERKKLCFQIYYPEDLLAKQRFNSKEWTELLDRLVALTRYTSTKYTRSKVRKALPPQFAYILEELLYQYDEHANKEEYYQAIYRSVIELGLVEDFAIALAHLIQRFVVDHLHVLGDVYDRGPNPDKIMDRLMTMPSLDIQLGNHDIIWLGAFAGSMPCLANVLRISLRYGHTELLEKEYGIKLCRLKKYAERYYEDQAAFRPRGDMAKSMSEEEQEAASKMQQAMSIMQFKLEGQLIERRPEFMMDRRRQLHLLSKDQKSITIEGQTYPIINGCFQEVDPDNPYELTLGEELILLDLMHQFQTSKRLQKHMDFLVNEGKIFQKYNGNLLFHGCIPCTPEGDFMAIELEGETYSGEELMIYFQEAIYKAYTYRNNLDDLYADTIWYMWCGEASNLFGKDQMRTFERYFIEAKETHDEKQNAYYRLRQEEDFCIKVLEEFGLTKEGYIINGHTPVKALKGEDPVKANGKMLVIDGGLSKAYQSVTGIAGYTLIDNSHGVYLVAHEKFTTREQAIQDLRDIYPSRVEVMRRKERSRIRDTDIGRDILLEIKYLLDKNYGPKEA